MRPPRRAAPISRRSIQTAVAEWISRGECGRRLGLSAQRIGQLCRVGMPTRADKCVPWPQAKDWYAANVDRARSGNPKYRQRTAPRRKNTNSKAPAGGLYESTNPPLFQEPLASASDSTVSYVNGRLSEPSVQLPQTLVMESHGRGETLVQAQLRKEQALATLRELEVAEKCGQVVPVGEVNLYMATIIVKARNALLRIGEELQDQLAAETEPAACQGLVDSEVRRALFGVRLFGEKWQEVFEGEGARSEEMRQLLGRMMVLVEGTPAFAVGD